MLSWHVFNAQLAGGSKIGNCLQEPALNPENLPSASCDISVHEVVEVGFWRQASPNELEICRIIILQNEKSDSNRRVHDAAHECQRNLAGFLSRGENNNRADELGDAYQ